MSKVGGLAMKVVSVTVALFALAVVNWAPGSSLAPRGSGNYADTTVKVIGTNFVQGGRPLSLIGINYFPAYYPPIYPGSWLDSTNYQPDIVEDELMTIERLGFNLVSIQGLSEDRRPSEQDCANLHDFLGRAQRHRLLVNLYIGTGGLVPIAEPEKLAVVPDACRLAGNPALFAYDIAWEPHFG